MIPNSESQVKITQVELPENLVGYGHPVQGPQGPQGPFNPTYNQVPGFNYGYPPAMNVQQFFVIPQPMNPLETELLDLKSNLRRNGGCFYCILCVLAFFAIFGIIRCIGLIGLIRDDDDVPRVVVGFIVTNLIQNILNIICVYPAREGIYKYNSNSMLVALRIIYLTFVVFIISNILYIIFNATWGDTTTWDYTFLIVNVIVGIVLYLTIIVNGRRHYFSILRINEIHRLLGAREL